MSAALCALLEVVALDPKPYKNLIPSFISILKQVMLPDSVFHLFCISSVQRCSCIPQRCCNSAH